MLRDRSVHIVFTSDTGPQALDALGSQIARSRLHVCALDVWCAGPGLDDHRVALLAAREGWRWIPPLRREPWSLSPGSALFGAGEDPAECQEALYERIRQLTRREPDGVAIVGVAGPGFGVLQLALHLAMTLLARPEDILLRLDGTLAELSLVRTATLRAAELRDVALDELRTVTSRPPVDELRGHLHLHVQGWTYSVRHRGEAVAQVHLGDRVGRTLAALVIEPGASAQRLLELVKDPAFGWSLEVDDAKTADDAARVEGRVNTWVSRLRAKLRPLTERGLGAFVPEPGSRRLAGVVDIRIDSGLPWSRADVCGPWTERRTSSPTSSTGSTSGPGSSTSGG